MSTKTRYLFLDLYYIVCSVGFLKQMSQKILNDVFKIWKIQKEKEKEKKN